MSGKFDFYLSIAHDKGLCALVKRCKEKNIKQKILLAQLQLKGIDIGQSSLSALEGQRREASDREVLALSQIFQVPMERLFQPPEE